MYIFIGALVTEKALYLLYALICGENFSISCNKKITMQCPSPKQGRLLSSLQQNDSIPFTAQEIARGVNKTFVFSSFWWGYSSLTIEGQGPALGAMGDIEREEGGGDFEDHAGEEEEWQVLNNETMVG